MATYANGRLPDSALAVIPGTKERVRADLVEQTAALRDAFQARFGKPLVVTDAYRTYAQQVSLKATKGVYAATPGTSNHGWGQAIDFGSRVNVEGSEEYRWMLDNAPRFGWTHPLWARDGNPLNGQQEPWHWEAVAVPVSNYRTTGGSVPAVPNPTAPTPIDPNTAEGDTMILVHHVNGKDQAYYTWTPLGGLQAVPPSPVNADLEVFKKVLPTVQVTGDVGLHPFVRATEKHVAGSKKNLGV